MASAGGGGGGGAASGRAAAASGTKWQWAGGQSGECEHKLQARMGRPFCGKKGHMKNTQVLLSHLVRVLLSAGCPERSDTKRGCGGEATDVVPLPTVAGETAP